MTVRRPRASRPRSGTPPLLPSSDMVSMPSRRSIQPPAQAPVAEVEAAHAAEPRGALQRTRQGIRPGVVRADDRLIPGALTARQQLVAAVPAAVRERPQLAILTADQQDAALPGGFGPL